MYAFVLVGAAAVACGIYLRRDQKLKDRIRFLENELENNKVIYEGQGNMNLCQYAEYLSLVLQLDNIITMIEIYLVTVRNDTLLDKLKLYKNEILKFTQHMCFVYPQDYGVVFRDALCKITKEFLEIRQKMDNDFPNPEFVSHSDDVQTNNDQTTNDAGIRRRLTQHTFITPEKDTHMELPDLNDESFNLRRVSDKNSICHTDIITVNSNTGDLEVSSIDKEINTTKVSDTTELFSNTETHPITDDEIMISLLSCLGDDKSTEIQEYKQPTTELFSNTEPITPPTDDEMMAQLLRRMRADGFTEIQEYKQPTTEQPVLQEYKQPTTEQPVLQEYKQPTTDNKKLDDDQITVTENPHADDSSDDNDDTLNDPSHLFDEKYINEYDRHVKVAACNLYYILHKFLF